MTEFRALAIVFVVVGIAASAAFWGLFALGASGALCALVFFLILGVGAATCSQIGEHYEAKQRGLEERHKREEILLSR